MQSKKQTLRILILSICILLLITDTKTATGGAAEGIDLCLRVVIPSLFPFFILATYMNASLLGLQIPGLRKLADLLHIPPNSESLLLLSLIGGYPVGAQLITDAYKAGQLSRKQSHILLGYCNNAGPSFIFGIAGILFSSQWIPFLLWSIHILSALITGFLLPRPEYSTFSGHSGTDISIVMALRKSISACSSVCGWVVTFKIVMAYVQKWASGFLNKEYLIILTGILELSNGCVCLDQIGNESLRFMLCTVFLAFGGLCVMLQTATVTESLGLGLYIPGKVAQTAISLLIAMFVSGFVFPGNQAYKSAFIITGLICIIIVIVIKVCSKKICGNLEKVNV